MSYSSKIKDFRSSPVSGQPPARYYGKLWDDGHALFFDNGFLGVSTIKRQPDYLARVASRENVSGRSAVLRDLDQWRTGFGGTGPLGQLPGWRQ